MQYEISKRDRASGIIHHLFSRNKGSLVLSYCENTKRYSVEVSPLTTAQITPKFMHMDTFLSTDNRDMLVKLALDVYNRTIFELINEDDYVKRYVIDLVSKIRKTTLTKGMISMLNLINSQK